MLWNCISEVFTYITTLCGQDLNQQNMNFIWLWCSFLCLLLSASYVGIVPDMLFYRGLGASLLKKSDQKKFCIIRPDFSFQWSRTTQEGFWLNFSDDFETKCLKFCVFQMFRHWSVIYDCTISVTRGNCRQHVRAWDESGHCKLNPPLPQR